MCDLWVAVDSVTSTTSDSRGQTPQLTEIQHLQSLYGGVLEQHAIDVRRIFEIRILMTKL